MQNNEIIQKKWMSMEDKQNQKAICYGVLSPPSKILQKNFQVLRTHINFYGDQANKKAGRGLDIQ